MQNKLSDLNNHLFMQLERLGDEELDQEGIEKEVARTGALVSVTDQIIKNAALQVKGVELMVNHGAFVKRHLKSFPLIEDGSDK
ncbi:hypothetical protein [Cohaesibacter celericrescens]|uniref:Uncharacterized protein n=1 Tax=Cohaesibacter celericrescens TaxID=2067669 RepID=A0A2N5XXD7_9HYPH|nr:hypothetical protein [Cohaesibacter celericrescens]PLW79088.1 hypothetical protein C0081_02325 [Cohaesibacter celericrescens]